MYKLIPFFIVYGITCVDLRLNITNGITIKLTTNQVTSQLAYDNISYCYIDDNCYIILIIRSVTTNITYILQRVNSVENGRYIWVGDDLFTRKVIKYGTYEINNNECVSLIQPNWRFSIYGLLFVLLSSIIIWFVYDKRIETVICKAWNNLKIWTNIIPSRGALLT
ncbi:hypothetical protein nvc2_088 [Namao virus]|nr:hypothetical protein nvc2_088 [Namao virus]